MNLLQLFLQLFAFQIFFSFIDDLLFIYFIYLSKKEVRPWVYKFWVFMSAILFTSIAFTILNNWIEKNISTFSEILIYGLGAFMIVYYFSSRVFKQNRKISNWSEYFLNLLRFYHPDLYYNVSFLMLVYFIVLAFFPFIVSFEIVDSLKYYFSYIYEINIFLFPLFF